ncbi:MAG: phosphatidylglycerophosphatase A [Muribaculaceae bacterium]|nr:phosphatidylglycerophosphatase A [Muribaculaceae bacterium]
MSDNNNHPLGEAPWFHVIFSTGLGTGFIPGAPGTAGAFLALLIWYGIYLLTGATATLFWITLGLIAATTVAGAWTSRIMERYWGEDPRTVVIDEFVGTWIPLLAAATPVSGETALLGLLGFAAFRVIDIVKTPLCRRMERVGNGWGVMLDDVVAGAYALLIVIAVRLICL